MAWATARARSLATSWLVWDSPFSNHGDPEARRSNSSQSSHSSKVSKRRNKQLFRDCLSFPGWTFGRASGDPRAQELPDLSDELVFYREVRVDLLAVHAPDDHPRFLLTLYLPEYLGLSCRPHLAFLVRLFLGAKRYESLIHSIVFAASSGTEAPRGFLLVNLHEWMTRVQDTHPGLQDPAPLYLDQAPDLN